MINYYEELKKYLEAKNYQGRLAHLETIKNRQVDVIKMYNQYKPEMKKSPMREELKPTSGKVFTIKSEDKAAFINRLDKMGIPVDTYKIHDNVLDDSFSIEFTNPESIKMIVQMLKQSPKIDVIKERLSKLLKKVYTDKAVVVKEAELDFNPDELEWENEDQCKVEVIEVLPTTQYSYLTARVKTPDCDIVDIEFDDYEMNNEIDHGMTEEGEEIWYGYIVGYYDRYVFYNPAAFTGSEEDGFEMIVDGDYDMIRAEIEDEENYN
jgi:hypothetical protein